MLTDRTYDILKWFALIFCDAFACCVLALGEIWGIPYAKEISAADLTAYCRRLAALIRAVSEAHNITWWNLI